jgi:aspartyl/asparaginyl beta-hydroxylase (cupin superfamily)
MGMLARFQGEWLRESLAPVIAKYGRDAVKRVERCVAALSGEESLTPSSSLQRPKFLFFPELNTSPYLAREQFGWIDALERDTNLIRQELMAVTGAELREPFLRLSSEAKTEDYLGGSRPEWTAYFFHRHGKSFPDHLQQCPHTASRISSIPLVSVANNAPEVLFSFLGPGTRILPHTGVTNTRVVVHLPLIVPDSCGLRVGGEVHHWEEGHCVIFDDTFEHEAWNDSDKLRVVLILDVWNPYMTAPECEAIAALVPAAEQYRNVIG